MFQFCSFSDRLLKFTVLELAGKRINLVMAMFHLFADAANNINMWKVLSCVIYVVLSYIM